MNRQASTVTVLAAAAMLFGAAVVGCARHEGGATTAPAASIQAAQATQAEATATPAATIVDATPGATDSAPSPQPTDAAVPTAPSGVTAAATPDPLDGQLANIDQLINGVNGSLSGSDAGTSGGE